MSFYATITGQLSIPKKAEKEMQTLIPYWEEFIEDNDEDITIGKKCTDDYILYSLDGLYKSLGRDLDIAVYKLLQKFPEVTGDFTIYSTDGALIFQEYSIDKGKLYRRQLGQQREVKLERIGSEDFAIDVLKEIDSH